MNILYLVGVLLAAFFTMFGIVATIGGEVGFQTPS